MTLSDAKRSPNNTLSDSGENRAAGMPREYSCAVMDGGAGLNGGCVAKANDAANAPLAEPAPPATVDILDSTGRLPTAHVNWLTEHLRGALRELRAGGEVRVRVVDDDAMASAHLRYSGVEGTTDVLTFDLTEPGRMLDVDVLVCLDEAERQGAERGHPRQHELLLYMVHGVLHCLGHDDHDEAGHERMHAEEDRLLRALGVGAVYGAGHHGGTT